MLNLEDKKELAIDLFNNTRISMNEIYELSGLADEISVEEFYEFLNNYRDKNGNKIEKRPYSAVTKEYKDLVKKLKDIHEEETRLKKEKQKQENLSKEGFLETVIYNMRCDGLSYRTISNELKKEFKLYISHETIRKICSEVFRNLNENEDEILSKLKSEKRKNTNYTNNQFTIGRNIYKYIPEDLLYEAKKHGLTYMEITEFLKTKGISVHPKTVSLRCNKIFAKKGECIPSIRKGELNHKRKAIKQEKLLDMMYEVGKKRKANKQQLELFAEEVSKMYNVKIEMFQDRER